MRRNGDYEVNYKVEENIEEVEQNNSVESQIKDYIINSNYQYRTPELVAHIYGLEIEGSFNSFKRKNSQAYDRISKKARKVREEIAREKGGEWLPLRDENGRHFFKLNTESEVS